MSDRTAGWWRGFWELALNLQSANKSGGGKVVDIRIFYARLHEMLNDMDRLENYIHQRCLCSCCATDKVCLPDCTYETDCPEEWQMMMAARRALYGDLPLDSEREK